MANERNLIAVKDDDALFPLYRSYQTVGTEIKEDFFKSKLTFEEKDYVAKNNSKLRRYVFKLSETNNKEGILGLSYGVFLMATLIDRFEQNNMFSADEKEKFKNSIIALLEYVEDNGYNVTPFATPAINAALFDKGCKTAFIESLTWSLSSFLYAKRLQKLDAKFGLEEYMDRLTDKIAQAIGLLVDNAISYSEDGRVQLGFVKDCNSYIGWGSVTGCTEPALYFTHSVCETYGDIEDTMLGNEMIGVGNTRDQKFIDDINSAYKRIKYGEKVHMGKDVDIVKRFEDICRIAARNVFKKYEKSLGKRFFYADGTEVLSNDQLSYSLQSPVLLNQLYVVLIAVYANYHKEVEQISRKRKNDDYKEFCAKLKNAVNLVHETYITLQSKGKAGIVNREYATFSEAHPQIEISQMLAGERINVAILETLIIKARAMVITYVTKYPEKEIGEVLKIIQENRAKDAWMWSNYGYDLQQTERSISAIREFYDYYENYQSLYAQCDLKNKEIAEKEAREWLAKEREFDAKNRAEEKAEMEERFAKEKQQAIEDTKKKYKVDGVVREIVREEIETEFVSVLTKYFKDIAKDNALPHSKSNLSPEASAVKKAIMELLFSFFAQFNRPFGRPEGIRDEWTDEQLYDLIKSDTYDFAREWVRQLYMKNEPGTDIPENVIAEIVEKHGKH